MTEPTRYPLAWPAHRNRTVPSARRTAKFSSFGKGLTVADALERLEGQLSAIRARYPLVSTNIEPRLDGRPRSGQPKPTDPGVCVYFTLQGQPIALACDTYTSVEDNLAAVAAHLDATRKIERHGVASAAETLQAFSALPPPAAGPAPTRPWRDIMGFEKAFGTVAGMMMPEECRTLIDMRYRKLARERHPDQGGTTDAMAELSRAKANALEELRAS